MFFLFTFVAEMKNTKEIAVVDPSTEDKIKNAARAVFYKKGFAATRTRDIAEEAGINLALLNYYFRSKEKLFDIIMLETLQGFFKSMQTVFNNMETNFEEKIDAVAVSYIDFVLANPDVPLFLMSELKMDPEELVKKVGTKEMLMKSHFLKQFQQGMKEGKIVVMNPLHFFTNLMSLMLFPFIASPMLKGIGDLSQKQFNDMMQERKKLIPIWIKAMIKPL